MMVFIGHKIETTSDNFGSLIRKNCLLVDKSLIIKEFIDGPTTSLITRPRRFGKTLTLSMLHHFFSPNVAGEATAGLFDRLAIAKVDNGTFLHAHQGQYPVIFMTFKDAKKNSFEGTVSCLRNLTQQLYREHQQCLDSDRLSVPDKAQFNQYLNGAVDSEALVFALRFLSEILHKIYGKKVIILIDEYDSPLTNAYQYTQKHLISTEEGFLCHLSNFMRDMFSAALKTNPYLEKGLMTGILRVSKNNMLSGLNNLEVYTLLDSTYAQYFGFTEEETQALLHHQQSDASLEAVRGYYNGYRIGESVMYNPWSLMSFLHKQALIPYWVATSNDRVLRDLLIGSDDDTKTQLTSLMLGDTISTEINLNLSYEDLMEKPSALWTLLLFCGYLTITKKRIEDLTLLCELRIPNQEIQAQYRSIFKDWLRERLGQSRYTSLLSSLLSGDVPVFIRSLSQYLMNSLSFHDIVGKKSERFYHGFVLGLIASVRDTHLISSNRESGLGLHDILITPKNRQYSTGVVIEFKYTKNKASLKNDAAIALQQMIDQRYETPLHECSLVKEIVKIGIAFCDKAVIAAYQRNNDTTVTWSDTYELDTDE